MTYDSREVSRYSGAPYELYRFQTETASWFLTTADEPKTYLGEVYTPETLDRTATSQGSEIQSGTMTITIAISHPISQLFVPYIPATPLFVTVFRAHDGEPDSETVVAFVGRVTSASFDDFAELTCSPEQAILKTVIPTPRYQKQCNRTLYDAGCGIDRELYKVVGILSSVTGVVLQAPQFATKPFDRLAASWLQTGYIEIGTQRRMIVLHAADKITLLAPMPGLVVGSAVTAYAGCMRTYKVCRTSFLNPDKFFGFEWIPAVNPFTQGL